VNSMAIMNRNTNRAQLALSSRICRGIYSFQRRCTWGSWSS
jgi:hypothetical protein